MDGLESPDLRRHKAVTLALVSRRPESPVWTWLALLVVLGGVVLALTGLPPIDLHGLLHYAGIMDPLCGGTRSVYLTMTGRWAAAWRYNPAAPLLLVVAVVWILRAAIGWSLQRWILLRVPRRPAIAIAIVALTALQVRQQWNVELLTAPWTGG